MHVCIYMKSPKITCFYLLIKSISIDKNQKLVHLEGGGYIVPPRSYSRPEHGLTLGCHFPIGERSICRVTGQQLSAGRAIQPTDLSSVYCLIGLRNTTAWPQR